MLWLFRGVIQSLPLCLSFPALGIEQHLGILGDLSISGSLIPKSRWTFQSDLLVGAVSASPSTTSKSDDLRFSVTGSYNSIGYRFTPTQSVSMGYGLQYVQAPLAAQPTFENRIWQQYTFEHSSEYGLFKLSSRLEERAINLAPGAAVRSRFLLQFNYPLTPSFYLVAAEEYFVNLNSVSWGPIAGFDQNRAFVGAGYWLDDQYRLELGYLNNYINRDLVQDLSVDFIALNFYLNLED